MKQKTHKAASKRIQKRTKRGQFLARTMSAQHRTSGKSARTLQRSRKLQSLSSANRRRLTKLLPYQ
ncbi:50S ribosomal protein L35 [Candidatus Berkelbacteria bacterium]|nr:50S ribosomal protein L35 [Candidatus Berkelbacteria bacterium]